MCIPERSGPAPSVRALPVPDPASSRILTTTARRHATRQNIPMSKIPMIGTNSQNALIGAESDRVNLSTRHPDVRYKWVREKVRNGELTLRWIETAQMKADGPTKSLHANKQADIVRPYRSIGMAKERKEEWGDLSTSWRTTHRRNDI